MSEPREYDKYPVLHPLEEAIKNVRTGSQDFANQVALRRNLVSRCIDVLAWADQNPDDTLRIDGEGS